MTKNDVVVGKVYLAKVSGKVARVKITSASPYGGWSGKNLATGKDVRIRSARRLTAPKRCGACPVCQTWDEEREIYTRLYRETKTVEDSQLVKTKWAERVKELECLAV